MDKVYLFIGNWEDATTDPTTETRVEGVFSTMELAYNRLTDYFKTELADYFEKFGFANVVFSFNKDRALITNSENTSRTKFYIKEFKIDK